MGTCVRGTLHTWDLLTREKLLWAWLSAGGKSPRIGVVRLVHKLLTTGSISRTIPSWLNLRYATMREKNQELQGLIAEQADVWRPQRYGWPNSIHACSTESPENPTSQLAVLVTIGVTKGRSVRTTHRLTKPRATIGKMGDG